MIEIRHTSPENLRNAYNDLYRVRSIQHDSRFYRWLITLLEPKPAHRLLDMSCGEGNLVQQAQQVGLDAWGIDLSDEAIAKARQNVSTANLMVCNGERVPFPDSFFDYVANIGSLEHYGVPEQGIAEIARVLSPRGRACILLPNSFGFLWNFQHVWRTGDVCDDGQPIQRYATRGQWEQLLKNNGLNVEQVIPHNFEYPSGCRAWLSFAKKSLGWIVVFLIKDFIPVNLANHLVFICSRQKRTPV